MSADTRGHSDRRARAHSATILSRLQRLLAGSAILASSHAVTAASALEASTVAVFRFDIVSLVEILLPLNNGDVADSSHGLISRSTYIFVLFSSRS